MSAKWKLKVWIKDLALIVYFSALVYCYLSFSLLFVLRHPAGAGGQEPGPAEHPQRPAARAAAAATAAAAGHDPHGDGADPGLHAAVGGAVRHGAGVQRPPPGPAGHVPPQPGHEPDAAAPKPKRHGPALPQRPAGPEAAGRGGQAVGMVGGYGQGMMMNPALSQQQMKGPPVGQPMAKAQAQRLQSMMGGGGHQGPAGWAQQQQQQTLQAMGGRTSAEIVGFSNSGPGYGMQAGQPRMAKQHFSQGMGQTMVDPRAMNPAMGGQMVPHMSGQPRTNQPRPMVMAGLGQGVPNMTPFSQGPGQAMAVTGGSYVQGGQPQGYQRTASQDLTYSYGGQSASAGSFNLPDGAELDSTDGWMDEFFPSQ